MAFIQGAYHASSGVWLTSRCLRLIQSKLDSNLYVGARDPETKRWPGHVDDDPEVRLGIGDRVYDARLEPISDTVLIARVRQAVAAKYGRLPPSDDVSMRYWRVEPRPPE